jgi:hypothetical protein
MDHVADPGQPRRRLGRPPPGDRDSTTGRQNIDEATGVEVDDPGHQHGGVLCGGGEERGLVQPDRTRGAETGEVIDAGSAVSRTAAIAVCHDTPKSRAAWATECSSGPTRRAISARARSVSTARAAIWSDSSDQVRAGHAGSGQRHRRLDHTSTTGRSARGRSRTTTRRRPWPTARTAAGLASGPALGGLHRQPPLTGRLLEQLGAHDEPLRSNQRGHAATVAFHQGPPVDVAVGQPHQ